MTRCSSLFCLPEALMKSIFRLAGFGCFSLLATVGCAIATEPNESVSQTRQAVSQADKDACSFKYNQVTTLTTTPISYGASKGFAGSSLAFADVTGDGKADLIAVSKVDTVVVWIGNGDGTFTKGPETTLTAPPAQKSYVGLGIVANADFDGDGKKDIVLVSTTAYSSSPGGSWFGKLVFVYGSASGALESMVQTGDVMNSGNGTVWHIAQDFDGDGKADFFYGNYGGQSIMFSNGRSFAAATSAGTGNPGGIVPFGSSLLFMSGATVNKVTWPGRAKSTTALTKPAVASDVFGDFDGDGKLDVAGKAESYPTTSIKIGTIDSTAGTPSTLYGFKGYTSLSSAADLNGDGKKELLYVDSDVLYGACGYAPGASDLVAAPVGIPMPYGISLMHAGDLNGDGKADFITTKSGAIQAAWVSQPKPATPSGQITLTSTPPKPTDPTPTPTTPGDPGTPPKKPGSSSGTPGEGEEEAPADEVAPTTPTTTTTESGCAQSPLHSTPTNLSLLGAAFALIALARRRR